MPWNPNGTRCGSATVATGSAAEVRCVEDHEIAAVLERVVDDGEHPSLVFGGRRAGRNEDAFAGLPARSELRGGRRARLQVVLQQRAERLDEVAQLATSTVYAYR